MNETTAQPKDVQKTDGQDKSPKGGGAGDSIGVKRWAGFLGGLTIFLLMLFSDSPEGLSLEGWRTAAVVLLMATWWVTEVMPIFGTALLPLILFPVLSIADIDTTATPYADPMIFLFLGGFVIAIAM